MATVGFALSSDLHLGSPARLNPRPRDPVNPGIGDLNPAGFAPFSPSLPGFDHDDEPDPSDAFAVGGRATDAKIGELFTRWLSMAHTQAWLGPEVDALKNGVWAPALDGTLASPAKADPNGVARPAGGSPQYPPRSVSGSPSPGDTGSPVPRASRHRRRREKSPLHGSPLHSEASPRGGQQPHQREPSPLGDDSVTLSSTAAAYDAAAGDGIFAGMATATGEPGDGGGDEDEVAAVVAARPSGHAAVDTEDDTNADADAAEPAGPLTPPGAKASFAQLKARAMIPNLLTASKFRPARGGGGFAGPTRTPKIVQFFQQHGGSVSLRFSDRLAAVCGLPRFVGLLAFTVACTDLEARTSINSIPETHFLHFWKVLSGKARTVAEAVFHIMTWGQTDVDRGLLLTPRLARPVVSQVLATHQGLQFLNTGDPAGENAFADRYIDAVVARLFFETGNIMSERMGLVAFQNSGFVEALWDLEKEDDINAARKFFSYDHFYVLYTTFWKYDSDGALEISQDLLASYDRDGLSQLTLDRVFEVMVRGKCYDADGNMVVPGSKSDPHPGSGKTPKGAPIQAVPGKHMKFFDFVGFMLAEEDKNARASIEYWFTVIDLDGDGAISAYEIEQFYTQQDRRLLQLNAENLAFPDFLCQMIDSVRATDSARIRLGDLKRCKQAKVFINALTNVNKFLAHEERDAFQDQADRLGPGKHIRNDWDRYAEQMYQILSNEEDDAVEPVKDFIDELMDSY